MLDIDQVVHSLDSAYGQTKHEGYGSLGSINWCDVYSGQVMDQRRFGIVHQLRIVLQCRTKQL